MKYSCDKRFSVFVDWDLNVCLLNFCALLTQTKLLCRFTISVYLASSFSLWFKYVFCFNNSANIIFCVSSSKFSGGGPGGIPSGRSNGLSFWKFCGDSLGIFLKGPSAENWYDRKAQTMTIHRPRTTKGVCFFLFKKLLSVNGREETLKIPLHA